MKSTKPTKAMVWRINILVPLAEILLATLLPAFGQPGITTDPQSRTNLLGTDATFTVVATGTEPLAYQWRFTAAELVGKTNDTMIVTNVQTANAGDYTVVVTNMEGAVTSVVATLTVLSPPQITKQPTNTTASLFADVTFSVTATGDPPLSYQWRFNDGDLSDKTNRTLTVTNVQRTNAGNYSVVVTNLSGSLTSQVVTLTIVPFHSIYFFGDSWTDTGGNGCNWSAPDYYRNRACNGPMWPEFLAASLGLTYGTSTTNVAHCGDTTADIRAQVLNRIRPSGKPDLSLYATLLPGLDLFVMYPGGYRGVHVNPTNQATVAKIINTAVQNVSNTVQNLYLKGARSILYMNQTGTNATDVPLLGWEGAGLYDAYARRYNAQFHAAMNAIRHRYGDVRIYEADLYALWDAVSTQPASFGFTDILTPGLSETNRAFDGPGASHLFWDDIAGHATSKFHNDMAGVIRDALRTNVFEEMTLLATNQTANIDMRHLLIGRDYTLQSSTNLSNWQDLQTFTAAAGTNQWTGVPDGSPAAFYRLKWWP